MLGCGWMVVVLLGSIRKYQPPSYLFPGVGPRAGGGLVSQSCPILVTPWTVARQVPCPWDSPGKNTGVGCHFLLEGIFLTQGSNPGLLRLLHCSWILYRPCHEGSPGITAGKPQVSVVIPFPGTTSREAQNPRYLPWVRRHEGRRRGSGRSPAGLAFPSCVALGGSQAQA